MAECIHGLEGGWCSLCKDYPRHSRPKPQGNRFVAKYEGVCSVEGDEISPGDTILYWGEEGRVAHASCLDTAIEIFGGEV